VDAGLNSNILVDYVEVFRSRQFCAGVRRVCSWIVLGNLQ